MALILAAAFWRAFFPLRMAVFFLQPVCIMFVSCVHLLNLPFCVLFILKAGSGIWAMLMQSPPRDISYICQAYFCIKKAGMTSAQGLVPADVCKQKSFSLFMGYFPVKTKKASNIPAQRRDNTTDTLIQT